jgi:hypothetical protein
MRVRPLSRSVPSPAIGETDRIWVAVTVIGEQWFGDVEQSVGATALSLARQSQAEVLQTFFVRDESDSLTFVGADLFPDFTNPALRDALRERLLAV